MPESIVTTGYHRRPPVPPLRSGIRTTSCPDHARNSASLIAIYLLGAAALCLGADTIPAPTIPLPPAIAHLTDAQDKLGTGTLKPSAEARSKADALYAEAMLLPQDGDQATALGLFRQIVTLDPSFTEAQIKLANLFLQTGQTDQALAQLRTASAAHPESLPIEVALGYTLRLHGQNDEAVRICTHALGRDSSQQAAMRVLLEVASDQDDLAGGVLHVTDILKKASDVTSATWLNFARLYLEIARGQRDPPPGDVILRTRLPLLQEAAAVPPPDVETLTQLADNYRDLGRKIEALSTLQRAAALEPTNADLVLRCAGLEADLNETDDAIKDYKKAYTLNPSLPGLRDLLGNLYLENGHYADAIGLFEAALAESPQNPGALIDLGIAYEGAHHPDKAQTCFQQVFDSVVCPVDAYLKLAAFQIDHKELKEAGATLASAKTHFPGAANVRFYQAIQHRYEKNYPAALACLNEVRLLAVGADSAALDPGYYMECALTLNLAGKKTELEAALREAMEKFPDNAELMNELAYFWADENQHLDDALALSQRATTLEPDNGPILDTLGWVYFKKDQAKDALPYLQRAAFLTNNDPVVLQHVGDAYLKLGLRREAIAAWTHALEKDPHNGDLANRIDAAQAQAKNAQLRSAPRP